MKKSRQEDYDLTEEVEQFKNFLRKKYEMDKEKISIVRRSDTSERRMNWWGMFFAFMSIVVLGGCTCWALYLDRPWFAGLLGTGTLITIVAMFVNRGGQTSQRKK